MFLSPKFPDNFPGGNADLHSVRPHISGIRKDQLMSLKASFLKKEMDVDDLYNLARIADHYRNQTGLFLSNLGKEKKWGDNESLNFEKTFIDLLDSYIEE
ncbi:hypothetical protein [Spirosoma aerolatum]|uniref:hypothetical protein n=1 Tax=Spirosoma aerolatum TaxID=1211326 RepID=UPI0009AD7DD5|nr:hypothetical protein [Spirosoma aerolatum]